MASQLPLETPLPTAPSLSSQDSHAGVLKPAQPQTSFRQLVSANQMSQAGSLLSPSGEASNNLASCGLSQEQEDRMRANKNLAFETLKIKHPKKARAALNKERALETRKAKKQERAERTAKNK